MSRQLKKGYFVKGQFVAYGSEVDEALRQEQKGNDLLSRTDKKNASHALKKLGEDLLDLRQDLLEKLSLPDRLLTAMTDAKRITDFGAKRRQLQYVGKLMRTLDESTITQAKLFLEEQTKPNAAATLLLHTIETWRDRFLADGAALQTWITQYPATDIQQLRSLVRQAQKTLVEEIHAGQSIRQNRAYRELFQFIKKQLAPPAEDTESD